MTPVRPYVGRFAPSPTGRLHMGSMVAAIGSFLEARSRGGKWLVRMEDLDPPREVPGAADNILRTLEGMGLHWDGEVMHQSDRHDAYASALDTLRKNDDAFGCICTRKDLTASGGLEVYPGTCREGLPVGVEARSWRLKMPLEGELAWEDGGCGPQCHLRYAVGDVVLKRADGHWAYHLASVVDDVSQGITDVVRGQDLMASTAAHLAIQEALKVPAPGYVHLPVRRNAEGQKLSKQTKAPAVNVSEAGKVIQETLAFLGQSMPTLDSPQRMLEEATANWHLPSQCL